MERLGFVIQPNWLKPVLNSSYWLHVQVVACGWIVLNIVMLTALWWTVAIGLVPAIVSTVITSLVILGAIPSLFGRRSETQLAT